MDELNWPLIKEVLGFLGTVCLAVPWFRDFQRRVRALEMEDIRAAGSLGAIVERIKAQDAARARNPQIFELLLMLCGVLLIAISFAIGVVLALQPAAPGHNCC